jgi:hypothetical protein
VITVIGIALALSSFGIATARWKLLTTEIEAPMKNLPPKLDGFTIVQISDVHIGRIIDSNRLSRVVQRVNSLRPDLIVITGDLVDEEARSLEAWRLSGASRGDPWRSAVPGNHDAMGWMRWYPLPRPVAFASCVMRAPSSRASCAHTGSMIPRWQARLAGPSFDCVIDEAARSYPSVLLFSDRWA